MTLRRLIVIAGIVAVAGVAYYFTTGRGSEVCSICLGYQGRTRCATAAAGTAADAVQRARRDVCYALSGADSSRNACMAAPPTSVQCRTR